MEKANRVLPGWEAEAADRVAEALESARLTNTRSGSIGFATKLGARREPANKPA